ncbi:MAG: hypothetical protein HQ485_09255 [Acidobacteria bacterium]|jgi:hypothetical protein|nr:hypothetical protein [Acidobacteriota bacterium]
MFELKPLSPAAITAALAKAERYRLLNEPEQCESICEDILRTDPDNHGARIALILAITDSFPRTTRAAVRATDLVAALPSEYDRCYYGGLVAERRGRAVLSGGGLGRRAATPWLQQAMADYERADALRPPEHDDARLRWNACARVFNAHPDLLEEDDQPGTPIMLE